MMLGTCYTRHAPVPHTFAGNLAALDFKDAKRSTIFHLKHHHYDLYFTRKSQYKLLAQKLDGRVDSITNNVFSGKGPVVGTDADRIAGHAQQWHLSGR
jgi:hypothetical protein